MSERKLVVKIIGDSASLQRSFLQSSRAGRQFEGSITGSLGKIKIGIGTLAKSFLVIEGLQKVMEGLAESVHLGTEEFADHARVAAQTQAVLKSTGAVANVSARQIDALALRLSNLSGVDDELIQQGENLLLSFTNIRNFAGKNNDIFTQATKIMVDFSVRTGRDAASAAVILGRALEDPATRVASLSRAGVVFTRQQIKQLQAIEKTKGVLAAQKVLLEALQKRFGGAGKAAGETLPGQLNILRDRFKDLAGSGIGLIAPSLSRAATGLTDFVKRFSEATSGRQKLHITVEGFETLGRDLVNGLQRQIASINFGGIGAAIGGKLRSINWRREIEGVGREIGAAIADSLQRLNEAIRSVNWNKVGQEIAKGVGLAIGAAAVFLHSLDIGRITKAVADVLGAALIAVAKILEGIGQEIGKAILKGITAGLAAAERPILKKADEIALAIIEPFTHLPFGIGKPAQEAKDALKKQLDAMAAAANNAARSVSAAITVASQAADTAVKVRHGLNLVTPQRPDAQPPTALPLAPPGPVRAPGGISASQRNRFFDNAIARILLRGGLGNIQQQIAALQRADALIAARLRVTKDITRRLNLEDQLLQNAAQIKGLRQDATQAIFDALQFGVTKAQATASFKDDISALLAFQAGIKREIAIEGKTLALQQQLFDVDQQIRQARKDQVQAGLDRTISRQFRELGLSSTGDALVPLQSGLRKRLAQLTANVRASSLDTPKLETELARFRKVLSEGLVPKDVRLKIREMMDEIADELKKGPRQLTKFAHVNSNAVLAGLGLSPEQTRALRARIDQIGAGGTVPGRRSPAFAGAGAGPPIVVHNNTYLDGELVARNTTKHQRKASQRRTDSRRGPYAGRN